MVGLEVEVKLEILCIIHLNFSIWLTPVNLLKSYWPLKGNRKGRSDLDFFSYERIDLTGGYQNTIAAL